MFQEIGARGGETDVLNGAGETFLAYLRRCLYQIVLREASRPEDLTGYPDRDTLTAMPPQLRP